MLNWSECLYTICIINWTAYMIKYITYSPNHLLTACCHLRQNWYYAIADGGHLGNWWPYWNNLNIRIVFVTLTVQFACSKHTLCYQNNLFWPFNAIFEAKNKFTPWRPSWKMATILKFCVARVFFLKSDPIEYLCQICCLYHNLNDSYVICSARPTKQCQAKMS